jgi:hypothetical protein
MKQKSQVQSIRFSAEQMGKIAWLKTKNFNPAVIIRNGFDAEFERFKKEYEKEQSKEILPF